MEYAGALHRNHLREEHSLPGDCSSTPASAEDSHQALPAALFAFPLQSRVYSPHSSQGTAPLNSSAKGPSHCPQSQPDVLLLHLFLFLQTAWLQMVLLPALHPFSLLVHWERAVFTCDGQAEPGCLDALLLLLNLPMPSFPPHYRTMEGPGWSPQELAFLSLLG